MVQLKANPESCFVQRSTCSSKDLAQPWFQITPDMMRVHRLVVRIIYGESSKNT